MEKINYSINLLKHEWNYFKSKSVVTTQNANSVWESNDYSRCMKITPRPNVYDGKQQSADDTFEDVLPHKIYNSLSRLWNRILKLKDILRVEAHREVFYSPRPITLNDS